MPLTKPFLHTPVDNFRDSSRPTGFLPEVASREKIKIQGTWWHWICDVCCYARNRVDGSSRAHKMVVAMLHLRWNNVGYHDLAEILQTKGW